MQEFDRVTNTRGRPRGSTAFTSNPSAPILTAPLPQGSQATIPASQPPIVPDSQPVRGRGAVRGKGAVRGRGSGARSATAAAPRGRAPRQSTGRESGTIPSIRRDPSQWEGIVLERSQTTVITSGITVLASNNASQGRGNARTPSSTTMIASSAPSGVTRRVGTQGTRVTRSRALALSQSVGNGSGQSEGEPTA